MKKAIILLPLLLMGCSSQPSSSSVSSSSVVVPSSSSSEVPSSSSSLAPAIESLHLDTPSLSLAVDEEFSLTFNVSPADADVSMLSWSSSNESIVSVSSSGIIKAKKVGEADIKVSDPNNTSIASVCHLHVFPKAKDEAEDASVAWDAKTMQAMLFSPQKKLGVTAYFRKDRLAHVPHLKIQDYYKLLLGKEMTVAVDQNGLFTLTAATGAKAIVDPKADTLQSDDYSLFIDTTIYRQDDVLNTYYDGAPFVRVNRSEQSAAPVKKTIDFHSYGINLIGQGNALYVPVPTLSNIFMGPTMLTCFFDASNLYFIDPNYPDFTTAKLLAQPEYNESLLTFFDKGKRTPEEASFSYGELCFFIDTYYGASGRESLHEAFIKHRSLDEALLNQDRVTKVARNFLRSDSQIDFYAGSIILGDYLSDAGHSLTSYGVAEVISTSDDLRGAVTDRIMEIGYSLGEESAARRADYFYVKGLSAMEEKRPAKNLEHYQKGDTVYFRFDAFDFNLHDWEKFYAHQGEMPQDCVGNLHKALEQYKEDSTVKNFILDISSNGGGYADIVFTMMRMMTGKAYLHYNDIVSGNTITTYYDIDVNFDGVFDEKDDAVRYPYHFAVLTSARSFSCGNLLPCQAKEQGVAIMGDNSGGGCCAVLEACSAEGMFVRSSSQIHMLNLDGGEVEGGADVAAKLVSKISETEYDFSRFYDMDVLSQAINDFYAK